MRCKNFTLNRGNTRGKNVKYNPYAFTEQGIYMLMTVLCGDLAIRQSRALIRTFKKMKDYIIENQDLKIQLYRSGGIFHDRYIILDYGTKDEKIFLCGASSKDAGRRITSILEDPDRIKYESMINSLLTNKKLVLK